MSRSRSAVLAAATAAALVGLLAPSVPASAASGVWATVAPSPVPQQEVSYAQAGGRMYLVGWMNSTQRVYDPTANTWSTVAPLPAPQPLNHIQVAAVGGKVYYIGGMAKWASISVGSVYVYDPVTDTFTTGAALPAGRDRGAGGVAVADGKIYLAGGVHDGTTVPWFDVYDPSTDVWTALPDMPHRRNHFQGAVVAGGFWAIGGRSSTSPSANVGYNEAFDLAAGTWTSGFAPLPTLRSGTVTAVFGTEIAVIGGEGDGIAHHEAEAYDSALNTWRTLAPMPTARHGMQAAMWNGAAYIADGGTAQGGGSATGVQEVLSLADGPRPDGQLKLAAATAYVGDGVYDTTGAGQTRSATAAPGTRRSFVIQVQNDGTATDGVTVRGCAASAGFTVRYLAGTSGTTDVTPFVVAGSYTMSGIAPGGSTALRLDVRPGTAAATGAVQSCLVTATSTSDGTLADAVLARVTVS